MLNIAGMEAGAEGQVWVRLKGIGFCSSPANQSGLVLTMWSIAVLKNHREPLTGSGDDGGWRRAAGF